jgi:hypothetical protein
MKIGVAGSMQFNQQMLETAGKLKKLGHNTFVSGFTKNYIGKTADEIEPLKLKDKYENEAIREFWQPMQSADALLVLNFDKNGIKNYIGGNTFLEMGFAYVLNQKIFLWNEIPKMPYYETEIIAMKPIVIKGNLNLIK